MPYRDIDSRRGASFDQVRMLFVRPDHRFPGSDQHLRNFELLFPESRLECLYKNGIEIGA